MNEAIAQVMQSANAYYGPGTLRTGGELRQNDLFFTGLHELDTATGGIPFGRIVEIFGAESSGKTALADLIARSAGETLYMDAERGLAHTAGITVMYPELLENALQAVTIAAPAFDAIVIDTVAALPTKEEAAADMGDFRQRSNTAVVLSRSLPRLVPVLLENRCTLILVNQLRDKPEVMYGVPYRPTGGRAIKHYAALRIETRRTEIVRQCGECVGQKMYVKVCKNKYGAPFGMASMFLAYTGEWRAAA